MPAHFERHGVRFVRPLLQLPGRALREWLQQAGISWVQDPTNDDRQRTRNRIRHGLLPALEEAFPQFRQTFARSARHAAQAQWLLSELAQDDLLQMGGQPLIPRLQALPRERQANLLRHWLRSAHAAQGSAAQVEELLDQIDACRTRGHHIRLRVGQGSVERVGQLLAFLPPL
jgi:tRNA(Ile)-lysidine synthase